MKRIFFILYLLKHASCRHGKVSEKFVLEAVSEAVMLQKNLPNVGEAGLSLFTLNMFRAQHLGLHVRTKLSSKKEIYWKVLSTLCMSST